ncbi:MAG: hypothetical protein NTW21_02495 [Verrucomicrobia bacterium]|nr:hypothetical protein [Verrucomicrobiota bacterium]
MVFGTLAEDIADSPGDTYRVDGYLVHLGARSDDLVNQSAYWYGMWAHQRDTRLWKGFLEIDLDPADDVTARLLLNPTPTSAIP